MLKTVCALILFTSLHVLAVENSAEVIEAERLIATSSAPAMAVAPAVQATAVQPAAVGTELKQPTIPGVNEVVATNAISEKSENEIPVQLDSAKKANSDHSLYFKAILSLIVVAGMGAGSYILIGRYRRANLTKSPATQIKVLTQHYLGPKRSLAIVRVAGESILIGITDHNISMIKSLALLDEDIPEETPGQFAALFASKTAQIDEAHSNQVAQQTAAQKAEDEEFSISGIKDFVSTRLKNMRTLE